MPRRVVNRNILRGYLVALKGTGNRTGIKVSEPVEPDFFLSKIAVRRDVKSPSRQSKVETCEDSMKCDKNDK